LLNLGTCSASGDMSASLKWVSGAIKNPVALTECVMLIHHGQQKIFLDGREDVVAKKDKIIKELMTLFERHLVTSNTSACVLVRVINKNEESAYAEREMRT
jgi:hypothetical protein